RWRAPWMLPPRRGWAGGMEVSAGEVSWRDGEMVTPPAWALAPPFWCAARAGAAAATMPMTLQMLMRTRFRHMSEMVTVGSFGHTPHLADLGQGQAFVVIEREHDLLPLPQPVDGHGQDLLHLLDLEGGHRALAAVGDRVAEGGRFASLPPDREDLVQGHEAD